MNPAAAVALAMQIVSLAPDLVRAAQSLKELYEMLTEGKEPSQAELDALMERTKENGQVIQELAEQDRTGHHSGPAK